MTDVVRLKKLNEVYLKITCDPGIAYELQDYFSFEVPGAKFMPAYKSGWDGLIRLFSPLNCLLYVGLRSKIEEFCHAREYEIQYDSDFGDQEFSVKEAIEFIKTLELPEKFVVRDYQMSTFIHAVRKGRELYVSPTASGKSLMIYLILRYFNVKTLVIVPTTNLVNQMYSDFEDYGYDSTNNVHKIMGGYDKHSDKKIFCSTWQSIYKLPKEWFSQFDLVIGDEAHLYKAKSLTSIMTKLDECSLRFGFTGTLDGALCNELVLQGLFGPTKIVTTSSTLMKSGDISELLIKIIVLNYPDHVKKMMVSYDYQQEIDYIVTRPERNNFIKNLALSLKGNTLILFQFVEKHGKVLHEMIENESGNDRNVYYISGEVDGDARDVIRKIMENEDDAIIVASSGTFSVGANIPKLHNLIFASPSKSRVRNLQSIGRSLRLHDTKSHATLFDIGDDLSWKSKKNYTLLHLIERMRIYVSEKFKYRLYQVNLDVS